MNALYYPFHLCHEQTLQRVLADFQQVHFRDFMALQLTPLMGTTAFPDRMGDYYPALLEAGRLVQGHTVSGSMNSDVIALVDRDLADPHWRSFFHEALKSDNRFQRGLFHVSQLPPKESSGSENVSVVSELVKLEWVDKFYEVETIQALSRKPLSGEFGLRFEYGFALIKTSAALIYTIQLCHELNLVAVTDSVSHYRLLATTCKRDGVEMENICVKREGY